MFTCRYLVYLRLLSVVLPLTLIAWPSSAQTLPAEELTSLLDKAETKEDHLRLASHYSAELEQFKQDADRHQSMFRRYQRELLSPKAGRSHHRKLAKHCKDLAASLRKAAEASEQLAATHRIIADEFE